MSKQTDKQSLELWVKFHEGLAKNIPVDESLSRREIERQRAELEKDPIAWIKYFFPDYAESEFAPFQLKAIRRLTENSKWYEVLSWSRELAKSTVAMFVLMYLALTKRKHFFVLASATGDAAVRLLTPYKTNFESNGRLKQFYGKQVLLGQWTTNEFTCRCGAKFIALGAGAAPRGMRNGAIRPDVIYFDDFDTDEDCRNPVTLQKKWDWAERALLPTRSISKPSLILWCGNIIAKDCCITRAGKIAKNWDIVNIRDKNGKSVWSKNTEEMIDEYLSGYSAAAIQAEFFNNPISEGKVFKNLPFGKIPPLKKFRFLIGYGDPAYSDSKKKGSSTKALWLIGKYKGVYYIIKGFLAHETNANFIGWYFELDKYVAGKTNVYWYIENNKLQDPFYQQVFKPLLREECAKRKTQLFIREDTRKKTDKATRIEANLEPLDRLGTWIFNEEEKDNPHMQELINQSKLFELTLPYPADGLDSVEGAVTMVDTKTGELEPTYTIALNDEDLNKDNPFIL